MGKCETFTLLPKSISKKIMIISVMLRVILEIVLRYLLL